MAIIACTAFSRRYVYQLPTSCIFRGRHEYRPVSNQYSVSFHSRAGAFKTHISLVIVCIHDFNCSLVQSHPPLHYLSVRIKCGDGRRRRRATPLLFCLSFIAMFILQSEMNTVHKKGTVGSGPRAGQAPQVAVSPTRSLSTLHRAHPPAALENWIWVRARASLGAF